MKLCAASAIALAASIVASVSTASAALKATGIRCEYSTNPIGIDVALPRLSWKLESDERAQNQTAYQVLAASSHELLAADRGDLWDSGKVISDQSLGVAYGGKPLASRMQVFWKVRVWDRGGVVSPYSEPSLWEMALMAPADWKAHWVRRNSPLPSRDEEFFQEHPAPLLRKAFRLEKEVRQARVYVSGLGYYELRLNGAKVGDQVLDPGWTTYSKRVLYSTFDVTEQLRRGENVVGMMLGNGWYNPLPLRMWGKINPREHLTIGPPRALVQLEVEYADGSRTTVASDETWKTADGPILRNSVYLGEEYDARRESPGWDRPGFDDSAWQPAVLLTEPLGTLRAQTQPPIKVTRGVKAVRVSEPKPGVFVFDFGQNFAGCVRLRARGPAGTKVTMASGELLYPNGTVDCRTSAVGQIKKGACAGGPGAPENAFQQDTYILRGEGDEVFAPRFTFHGFRYVEVSGYPGRPSVESLEGLRMNSAVSPAGEFRCSSEMFNRIQEMVRWTLLSNLFSVQSDCPHREKFGYGGDIVASGEMAILNFDMATFYAKAVRDLADAVRSNGGFTETSPYVGISDLGLGDQSGPIGWGAAHPLLQHHLYRYYGDRRLIEEQCEFTRRWIALLESKAKDGILDNGIGDHESLVPKSTGVSGTAFYYHNVCLARRLAELLGRKEDAARYGALATSIQAAFNRRFLDAANGRYDTGTQANQAFALALGLVPAEHRGAVLTALVDDVLVKHQGHLTTGIFGTNYMLASLSDLGRPEVAFTVASQKTFPGWGYMLERGATALWEHWEYDDHVFSHNHPMFGSVSAWFFKTLAGIQAAEDAAGFDKIVLRPDIVGDLTWAQGRYDSVRGPIESSWRKDGPRLVWEIAVPIGATAVAHVPAAKVEQITENGRPVNQVPELKYLGLASGKVLLRVPSGQYRFVVE